MDALSQDDIRNPTESITVNNRVIFIEILGERDSPQPNRRVIIGGKDYLLLSTKWDWGYRVGNKIDGTPIPTCDSFLTAAEKRKAHHWYALVDSLALITILTHTLVRNASMPLS